MFNLTKQEQLVLGILVFVLALGSLLDFVFRLYPSIQTNISLIDQELYPRLDINKASEEELIALPYIGPVTAKNIVEYRQVNGSFKSLEELKDVRGVYLKNYEQFIKFLKINQ